jgi:hypothetical protein
MFGRTRSSGFGFLDVGISREILELEVGEAPPTLSTEQFRGIISSAPVRVEAFLATTASETGVRAPRTMFDFDA